jgi:PIN domain nuclease of toxin-antitoxin system
MVARDAGRAGVATALIAQAMVEDLALVTTDGEIRRYACERLRMVR